MVGVGHLEHDFLDPLQILLTCDECNKKCDRECLKSGHDLIFKPSDIVLVLHEAKKRYLGDGELRNVHLFLDEVSHLGTDWASLDELAENPTNSIWLSSNPEHYNENIERINLRNFKNISLDLVLRNTKLINNLANDVRRYILGYRKVAKKINLVYSEEQTILVYTT